MGAPSLEGGPGPPLARLDPASRRRLYVVLGGSGFSAFGNALYTLALGFIVFRETKSASAIAFAAASFSISYALSSLPGGRIAARHELRRVAIGCESAGLVVAVVLAVVAGTGADLHWWLVGSAVLNGFLVGIFYPAWQRILAMLVPEEYLLTAVATNSTISQSAHLIGFAVSGTLMAYAGDNILFWLNAASFVPFIVALGTLAPAVAPPYRGHHRPAWIPGTIPHPGMSHFPRLRRFLELGRQPGVGDALVVVGVASLLISPLASLLPVIANYLGTSSAHAVALLSIALGLGAVFQEPVIRHGRNRFGVELLLAGVYVVAAVLVILLGFGGPVLLAATFLVPIGLAVAMGTSMVQASVQLAASPEDRSETLGLYAFTFSAAAPLGTMMWGHIAEGFGVDVTLVFAGATLATCVVSLALLGAFERIGRTLLHAGAHTLAFPMTPRG